MLSSSVLLFQGMDQHFLLPNFRFPFAISPFLIVTAWWGWNPEHRLLTHGSETDWEPIANLCFGPQLCRISSCLLFWFFFLQTFVGENHRRKGLSFKLVILLTGSTSKLLTVLQTAKTKHNQVQLTCLINFWVIHNSRSGNIYWKSQLQCKQHDVILTDLKWDRETQRT